MIPNSSILLKLKLMPRTRYESKNLAIFQRKIYITNVLQQDIINLFTESVCKCKS